MTSLSPPRATLDDLYREEGKAELIGGRIVRFMAAGDLPSLMAFEIAVSLREHTRQTGRGTAYADGTGFAISELPSGRESFSPDAAFYLGPRSTNRMRFVPGAPTLAVEVRSENDYGKSAETAMAEKRGDYFAAGTLVVWDVDPIAEYVHVYRATDPDRPTTYAHSQVAEAEPAVPGWRPLVASFFA